MGLFQCSVIATTYNQSRDLDLYLTSLEDQVEAPTFEVIIADDGSQADTAEVIEKHRGFFGDRLKRVWHEDLGYRKCKILNAALRQVSSDWIVFTDSDLILHPLFLRDHYSKREPHSLFMGRRVDLAPTVSEWIRSHPSQLSSTEFYLRVLVSGSKNVQRLFRFSSPSVAAMLGADQVPDLLGSNFSIDRSLIEAVNGFDEASVHYWGEDGDLFVRVRNSGAKITGHKYYAVQFHLWHKQREPLPDAHAAYQKKLSDLSYRVCVNGLRTEN